MSFDLDVLKDFCEKHGGKYNLKPIPPDNPDNPEKPYNAAQPWTAIAKCALKGLVIEVNSGQDITGTLTIIKDNLRVQWGNNFDEMHTKKGDAIEFVASTEQYEPSALITVFKNGEIVAWF